MSVVTGEVRVSFWITDSNNRFEEAIWERRDELNGKLDLWGDNLVVLVYGSLSDSNDEAYNDSITIQEILRESTQ